MSSHARTYVLVHGAFHGGWCWRRVADRLLAAGHRVFTPTCTGNGERLHLLTAEGGLETAIADVVNVLIFEELENVILVGHSFGGVVITGVADCEPDRIAHLVYLDGTVLESGECALDHLPATLAAKRRQDAQRTTAGLTIPPPSPADFGVTDAADTAWLRRRLTPQPLTTYTERLLLSAPFGNGRPKTYIACTAPLYTPLAASHARARGQSGWHWCDVPSGHDAMITAPDAVAGILLDLV
jgi:Predicted hydrolases or acyltransferases (alpha/beta hydrolase superfamily)